MKFFLTCVVSTFLGLAQAEVPKLFCQKPFTSATIAEAVNRYVAIGETATIKQLQQLSAQENSSGDVFIGKGFNVNERIGWVCRILFEPRGHSPLRAPKFGMLPLPEDSMPADKWPLYPVALSGSTYFVLKQSYTPSGKMESTEHYLAYCQDSGVFRTMPLEIPTKDQANLDAASLRQSLAWQNIQWEGGGGFSFPMGEQLTFGFIRNQAKTIAAEPVAKVNSKADSVALTLR